MRHEYPAEDYYYTVMPSSTPADNPARKLVYWLLTDDGQAVAARAGYIPVRIYHSTRRQEVSCHFLGLGAGALNFNRSLTLD